MHELRDEKKENMKKKERRRGGPVGLGPAADDRSIIASQVPRGGGKVGATLPLC